MTPDEHDAQRARVIASMRVDDARATHHTVYPLRRTETIPGAHLAVAVARVEAFRAERAEAELRRQYP